MKRLSSLRGILAFLFLLALATSSLFDACHATRGKHWRKSGDRRHGPSSRPIHPPVPTPMPTPSPPPIPTTFSVLDFGAVGDGSTDDTKAFQDTWAAACNVEASTVVVPANFQFLVGPVSFTGESCQPNIVFQLNGAIVASTSPEAWSSGYVPQWLEFRNARGLTIRGSGTVDGQGSCWWSSNSELDSNLPELNSEFVGTNNRPTAVRLQDCSNTTVTGITIQNSAKFHLTFDTCQAVEVHGVTISSPGNSPNTDGIHLQSSVGVSIHHTTLACGDDCISIQDGCSNVFIHNVNCGPGHGISIGGLGKGNTQAVVSDITVQDASMTQTMTGVRIKTWQGGSGSVKNIRFANIRVSEVKTPIVIDQFYCDHTRCTNQSMAVALSDITYQGIVGTYTTRPVYLACSDSRPCSNLHLANIELAPIKETYHLYGPFCWNAYGDVRPPTEPPIDCLRTGRP